MDMHMSVQCLNQLPSPMSTRIMQHLRCCSVRVHVLQAAILLLAMLGTLAAAIRTYPSSSKMQHPNELSAAEANRKLGMSFFKSDELGVSHCSLQGIVGEEDVTLHIWLRMAPGAVVDGSRAVVARGFALLQSSRRSIPTGGPVGLQLLQAGSVNLFSKNVYLRSYVTGIEYPLNVTLYSNSRFRPWDASRPSEGWTNHVMDLDADLMLDAGDLEQEDFELRAEGFNWHCPFLIEPPVLGYKTPSRQLPSEGAGQSEPETPPWVHHPSSSLSDNTQVWQLLSPFYRITTHDYAKMLWHRVLWHKPLGMDKYLLYVYENLSPLLREPLIQELVSQGVLHVIMYTDMPKHERRPLHPSATDLYTMQVLAYNHALLALWGSDSLVLVADVDEYIITPKPTSVVQAFKECRNSTAPTRPSAGLQLRRTDAVCAPHVDASRCTTSVPGLLLWTNASLGDVRAGSAPHPMSWHAMSAGQDLWDHHNTKALVDPNLARDVHVHFFKGRPGTTRDDGNTDCIRLLHLVDLYKVRHSRSAEPVHSVNMGNSTWFWPVERVKSGVR